MLYQTMIPGTKVSKADIESMTDMLKTLTTKEIDIELMFVLSTDDPSVSTMLDGLRDAIEDGTAPQPVKVKKVKGSKKVKAEKSDGPKAEPTRGPHVRSITVKSTGEKISRFELDKRLVAHSIATLEVVHSPKYGNLTVVGGPSEDEPYMLMTENGDLL